MRKVLDLELFNSLNKANKSLIVFMLKGYTIDRHGIIKNKKGLSLKPYYGKYLRHSAIFNIDGSRKHFSISVHRYQAFMKYGLEIFSDGLEVRHLNNVRDDNRYCNILLGTKSQNYHDNPKEQNEAILKMAVAAAASKRRNENVVMWADIYIDRSNGMSYNQLRDKYSVSKSSLSFHFGNGKEKVDEDYKSIINEEINNR